MQSYESRHVEDSGSYSIAWEFLRSRIRLLQIGLLTAAFIYLYTPTFGYLYWTWLRRGDMSHGFLIPLISLYLVWIRQDKLRDLHPRPACLAGISVAILAGTMFLAGEIGGLITLSELSIIVMIVGLVLCLFGKDYLRTLLFPIAYLIFMLPIASDVFVPLYRPMQLLTAKVAATLLEGWGIPVLLDRTYLTLPSLVLEVIPGCSGVSSLIAILAIGIPLGFMTQRRTWCTVVMLISAVIAGFVANWTRVFSMGLYAYYYGNVLQEPFHTFQGLFFAQIGFVSLFVVAWILSKVPAAPSKVPGAPSKGTLPEIPLARGKVEEQVSRWNKSWLAALVVFLALTSYLSFYDRQVVPPRLELATFPLTVGTWSGQETDLNKAAFRVRGADHEIVRTYRSPSGREYQLYVAYFESQRQSKEIVNWLTARLHLNSTVVDIPIDQRKSISVNYISNHQFSPENNSLVRNIQSNQHVFFWYNINGRILADRYKAKFASILNALKYGRTNGAFVLVSTAAADRGGEKEVIREKRALIRDFVPVLHRYIP